jgi:hypothetical protein
MYTVETCCLDVLISTCVVLDSFNKYMTSSITQRNGFHKNNGCNTLYILLWLFPNVYLLPVYDIWKINKWNEYLCKSSWISSTQISTSADNQIMFTESYLLPTTSEVRFLSNVIKLLGILYITLVPQLCMNCIPTVQLLLVISQAVNFLPSC